MKPWLTLAEEEHQRLLDQVKNLEQRIANQRRALAGLNKAYYAARKNEEAFGRFVDATTFGEFRAILKRVAVQKMSETENEDTCDDCRPTTFGDETYEGCECPECLYGSNTVFWTPRG